ncbi:MAG: toll/interleukin-1 receptor domain-containing protein [Bryobacteraceae bacterium]
MATPDFIEANLGARYLLSANLSGANLRAAKLNRTELMAADLTEADLSEADLRGADLSMAKLAEANLSGANLTGADLREANFSNADLLDADLRGADLTGADLSKANLYETVFGDTSLSDVHGLDTCAHFGPSTLDHRTLAKSGRLPLEFLRGCGLPDKLIDYLPSLLNEAIQFYSCFISYSTEDQTFAERLHADLQDKGVRCWFAPHDIQGGKKIHEQIDEAIRVYDRLLLIVSTHSMKSEWVRTEIARARRRELRENRRMLFPVRLVDFETVRDWECFDGDTGKDSAREIREYFIPDFCNWKDFDSYETAFERLVRDLKTEAAPQASA